MCLPVTTPWEDCLAYAFSRLSMSSLTATQGFCHCIYPSVVHPGKCVKCNLSHKEVSKLLLLAVDIPHRFWEQQRISWETLSLLEEEINNIARSTFYEICGMFTCVNLLNYFQDSVYTKVRELFISSPYQLELLPEDETMFKCFRQHFLIHGHSQQVAAGSSSSSRSSTNPLRLTD